MLFNLFFYLLILDILLISYIPKMKYYINRLCLLIKCCLKGCEKPICL